MARAGEIKNRIGEAKDQRNGHSCIVIECNGCKDILVEFEDKTQVRTTYYKFNHGNVIYPGEVYFYKKEASKQQGIERLGEVHLQKCGMNCKIVEYNSCSDITVEFEDGFKSKHRQYSEFILGTILNPALKKTHLGEVNYSKQGQQMTIIEYNGVHNCTVEFEDGTVVKECYYSCFKKGGIKNPNFRVGKEVLMSCGLKATIIKDYLDGKHIDIQFEDGVILEKVSLSHFYHGYIKHPNINANIKKGNFIGVEVKTTCGLKCKVIDYINGDNCTVEFEDGTVLYGVSFSSFKMGYVKHPTIHNRTAIKRLGVVKTMKNGMSCKCIRYENSGDISVEFEDGTIVEHTRWSDFNLCTVGNPNLPYDYTNSVLRNGEEFITTCGLKCKIIDYKTWYDVTVEFEDGVVVNNLGYGSIQRGQVGHPYLKSKGKCDYCGYYVERIVYRDEKAVYYSVINKSTNQADILTPQEMYQCN